MTTAPAPVVAATLLPPPSNPMAVARRLVEDLYTDPNGAVTLAAHRGEMRAYDGHAWPLVGTDTLKAGAYAWLEHATYTSPKEGTVAWKPTITKVNNVLESLAAACHLPETVEPPCWLAGQGPDPQDVIVCANGILDHRSRTLHPLTPRLYAHHSLEFDYEPDCGKPVRWLRFLESIWEDDTESMVLTQQWFGYCLSRRTHMQKAALLIGPTRSGKGVIARTLTQVMGAGAVGAPTLAGLQQNFGLQSILGKTVAIISDARLDASANVQALAERLLTISGEDQVTIDRKFIAPWSGRLGARFMLLTNNMPTIPDPSGALAKRFLPLVFTKSFYGNEDLAMEAEIADELPGILNWALDGLDILLEDGRFIIPETSRQVMGEFEDAGAPVGAFLRERCVLGKGHQCPVDDLWKAWTDWCADQNRKTGTRQGFGKSLRSSVPFLRVSQPRGAQGKQVRHYENVGLQVDGLFEQAPDF